MSSSMLPSFLMPAAPQAGGVSGSFHVPGLGTGFAASVPEVGDVEGIAVYIIYQLAIPMHNNAAESFGTFDQQRLIRTDTGIPG